MKFKLNWNKFSNLFFITSFKFWRKRHFSYSKWFISVIDSKTNDFVVYLWQSLEGDSSARMYPPQIIGILSCPSTPNAKSTAVLNGVRSSQTPVADSKSSISKVFVKSLTIGPVLPRPTSSLESPEKIIRY